MKLFIRVCSVLLVTGAVFVVLRQRSGRSATVISTGEAEAVVPGLLRVHPEDGLAPGGPSVGAGDRTAYALPEERVLQFPDSKQLHDFMRQWEGRGITVVGEIPALQAVRVRLDSRATNLDWSTVPGLKGSTPNYRIAVPSPDAASPKSATPLVAYGESWPAALGISRLDPSWGRGVRVAVIDTGLDSSVLAPNHLIGSLDATNNSMASARTSSLSAPASPGNEGVQTPPFDHATAVASLIAGNGQSAPAGVAPQSQILDVKGLDSEGTGDTFSVASAIVRATDAGSQIINLSLGTSEDSPVLRQAVVYAQQHHVALIAASGNDGLGQVAYPAQYPGVLAVGATDASLQPTYFSNYGENLGLLAPGTGLTAGQAHSQTAAFSGTSAATALASGAVAAILSSEPSLQPDQAAKLLCQYANDVGLPGYDPDTGYGEINLQRVLERNQPNIIDAAVASQLVLHNPGDATQPVSIGITVQNRGTVPLVNALLTTHAGLAVNSWPISYLLPGQSSMQTIQVYPSQLSNGTIQLISEITLAGLVDRDPSNNRLNTRLTVHPASP